jgi:hypothetical protein
LNGNPIHVCVISDQLLGNLIPVLQLKPMRVIALATQTMQERGLADRFGYLLKARKVPFVIREFPDTGFTEALAAARLLAVQLGKEFPDSPVGINVTGGTKSMAFALVVGLQEHRRASVFYCDTQNNVLETFEVEPEHQRIALQNIVDVELAVSAQGYAIVGNPRPLNVDKALLDIASSLVRAAVWEPQHIVAFQGWVNQPGMGPQERGLVPPKNFGDFVPGILAKAVELDLMIRDRQGRMRFSLAENGFLRKSGWFEAHCADQIRRAGAENVVLDLKLKAVPGANVSRLPDNKDNDQQFDVAATWRNRLILVECKATTPTVDHGRWIAGGAHRAGGLFGIKLLAATGAADPIVADRIAALGWKLFSHVDVEFLHEHVSKWMHDSARN